MFDDLVAFIRARMEAAAVDKAIYERNGARLNGQLLQGEINMGNAVLTWLEKQRTGVAETEAEDEEDVDAAGG